MCIIHCIVSCNSLLFHIVWVYMYMLGMDLYNFQLIVFVFLNCGAWSLMVIISLHG